MVDQPYEIVPILPDLEGFKRLRAETNWGIPDDFSLQTAMENSLFGAIAITGTQTIGMIRVVGDGALNVYIQDVIVVAHSRGRGIGHRLVKSAILWMQDNLPSDVTVGLMSAQGQDLFYKDFGFAARPSPNFGPGMQSQLSNLVIP